MKVPCRCRSLSSRKPQYGRDGCSTAVVPFGIRICRLREAESFAKAFGPKHIIVIADTSQDSTPELDDVVVLRLSFWDLDRVIAPGDHMWASLSRRGSVRIPEVGDIQAILEFGRGVPPGGWLLCCCGAGWSRSAAAAATITVAQMMPGHEGEAVLLVRQVRPMACSNSLMIRLVDELLDDGGRFVGSLGGAGDQAAGHSS